jgi:hypothetical protein
MKKESTLVKHQLHVETSDSVLAMLKPKGQFCSESTTLQRYIPSVRAKKHTDMIKEFQVSC